MYCTYKHTYYISMCRIYTYISDCRVTLYSSNMLKKTHRLPNVYLPIAYGGPTPRNSDKENSSAQLKLPQAMRGNSEKYGMETRLLQPRGGLQFFFGDPPPSFFVNKGLKKNTSSTVSTVFGDFRDHFWLHLTTLWIGERPRDKMPSQSSALIHCGQFSNPLRRIPHLTGIAKG